MLLRALILLLLCMNVGVAVWWPTIRAHERPAGSAARTTASHPRPRHRAVCRIRASGRQEGWLRAVSRLAPARYTCCFKPRGEN